LHRLAQNYCHELCPLEGRAPSGIARGVEEIDPDGTKMAAAGAATQAVFIAVSRQPLNFYGAIDACDLDTKTHHQSITFGQRDVAAGQSRDEPVVAVRGDTLPCPMQAASIANVDHELSGGARAMAAWVIG